MEGALVSLLILLLIAAVVIWAAGQLGLPANIVRIVQVVVAVIVLIYLIQLLLGGGLHFGTVDVD